MAAVSTDAQQNVVSRVASLPLVSSTYDMVSSAYVNTKDNYPYLKSVCEMAEKGVKSITAVALTSALPIIQKLEPQIAVANTYACMGLDKVEEKLPILYQPTGKVGCWDIFLFAFNPIISVHDMGLMTKLIGLYFDSAEKEATNIEGFETGDQKLSYYVRLGSLSSKVRARAYQQALNAFRDAKLKSQETISQLNYTVNLLEYARKNMTNANVKLQDAQQKLYNSWTEWKKNISPNGEAASHSAEHIESRTLAIAQNLSQQLQTTCLTLVSSIQGLPQNIQDQVHHVGEIAGDVYKSFRSASSFKEVSDNLLTSSKGQLKKMKESLDDVMDYLVNNTPLNWLIPDFTITELSSESDEIPDISDLDEEGLPDYSHANGPITMEQIVEA
ncbi:PREDICTED: perilipin-2 [Thamnophis sirtalis]|uniref:Perilipin n=1 Tax=Thamnophis sirtalis TaxID=35019 RepID=A0A6I9XGG1_9SAUR|nr:PREDICTED: perilipin-2 [Thamnophis sirtalis]